MTLITALCMDNNPAVFGDLVISGPKDQGRAIHVPAVGDTSNVFPADSDRAIVGLNQKVVLIGDKCAIVWAGNEWLAGRIVGELRELASQAPLTARIIGDRLSKLDLADGSKVTFAGWVHKGDQFGQFWFNASTGANGLFGRIAAGGTGGAGFIDLTSQLPPGSVVDSAQPITGLDRVIVSLLGVTGLLLRAELSSQSTLKNRFGGGYEIATFVGNKFEKIGDILFVFWAATVTAPDIVALHAPALVLKQDYDGDSLLLRVLRMTPGKVAAEPRFVISEDFHLIEPFGVPARKAKGRTVPYPGMEARYICHVIHVQSPKGIGIFTRINYRPSRELRDISFSFAKDTITFGASQAFCKSLTDSVRAGYAQRPAT